MASATWAVGRVKVRGARSGGAWRERLRGGDRRERERHTQRRERERSRDKQTDRGEEVWGADINAQSIMTVLF